jgi:hypothetical protein
VGHFWELHPVFFSAVSCVGFLRSKARRRRQFCAELRYHFSCYGLLLLLLQFGSVYEFMAVI